MTRRGSGTAPDGRVCTALIGTSAGWRGWKIEGGGRLKESDECARRGWAWQRRHHLRRMNDRDRFGHPVERSPRIDTRANVDVGQVGNHVHGCLSCRKLQDLYGGRASVSHTREPLDCADVLGKL